ncbi:PDDEXK nuclease domain-containing protein, partial [Aeromonas caviae]
FHVEPPAFKIRENSTYEHLSFSGGLPLELKIGEFKAAYKGQMELYLRWLDKHEREPEEASPLGIILCTGKKSEQIELLELDKSGIHVAEYLTTLPPRAVLGERLQQATERARLQIEQRQPGEKS